ncbi:TPA: hypothetical protein DCQ44_00060 [Candidatus Taylorbacteria bacterium]|nr:hypothetical protein [Candidatus Taylorbacteria bacterium]
MENQTEILKKYIKNLPEEMRDYLAKNTWPQKLTLISTMNKLGAEQVSALETEVVLVLVGIENCSDLTANIQKNVVGISSEISKTISDEIEKNIFVEIKALLDDLEAINNSSEKESAETLNKDGVLNDIENPIPTKPIIQPKINPAGTNPILDAQHNLPEGEKKILISSAAVPSRGPILNNVNMGFVNTQKNSPVVPPVQHQAPTQMPPQEKYTVDPYREPAE